MKRILPLLMLCLYCITTASCFASGKEEKNVIRIIQPSVSGTDSPTYTITSEDTTLELDRRPFLIQYSCRKYDEENNKYYTMQMAVVDKPFESLRSGATTGQFSFFSPGTGLATAGPYSSLFVTDSGHHYIYYISEEDKRASLISQKGKELELQIAVRAFDFDGDDKGDLAIEDSKVNRLWFMIFIDQNLNDKIDKGELHRIAVHFK